MSDSIDVAIVGAGLAGLNCARVLTDAGLSVRVFDSSDGVGGRVRTDEVAGFRLDRGFQTVLTEYPEFKDALDVPALDLRPFWPGACVRYKNQFYQVADPAKEPRKALQSLTGPIGSLADKARVLKLRAAVTRFTQATLDQRDDVTTAEALANRYRFSSNITDRFFRPFFGGVFLDRDLSVSSRFFEFLFRMFAVGETAIPAKGMQVIPEQLAGRLPSGSVRLNARVTAASDTSVRLESGNVIQARAVVLAVDGPELAYLADGFDPPESHSTCCLYYASETSPHPYPMLILDGDGRGPVNHLAVMSEVSGELAPPGWSLISASVVGSPALPDDEIEARARAQLHAWYGDAIASWQLLKMYRIVHALPSLEPGESSSTRPARFASGVFACGDHLETPSINGALTSGRKAAEAVQQYLATS